MVKAKPTTGTTRCMTSTNDSITPADASSDAKQDAAGKSLPSAQTTVEKVDATVQHPIRINESSARRSAALTVSNYSQRSPCNVDQIGPQTAAISRTEKRPAPTDSAPQRMSKKAKKDYRNLLLVPIPNDVPPTPSCCSQSAASC